jgi:hypothetical protein
MFIFSCNSSATEVGPPFVRFTYNTHVLISEHIKEQMIEMLALDLWSRNHILYPKIPTILIQFYYNFIIVIFLTFQGLLCGAYQFELKDLEEACWEYIGRRIEHDCVYVILTSARAYKQHRNANEIYNTVSNLILAHLLNNF